MAFKDISPQGPVHFLVIPKDKDGLNRLSNAREDQKGLLGHLMYTAQQCAREQGLVPGGFRLVCYKLHANFATNFPQYNFQLNFHVVSLSLVSLTSPRL